MNFLETMTNEIRSKKTNVTKQVKKKVIWKFVGRNWKENQTKYTKK